MKKLTLAYFGSPDFSADFLEKLIVSEMVEIKLVLTQPDKPVGRKQIFTATPVKQIAERNGIRVCHSLDSCDSLNQFDLALVYAYASIIPKELLNVPKYGFWCIHPSLLPKYRGTSPMATALINGDKETGVTIIKMDEKIDHGPIITQEKYKIQSTDKRPDLETKLTRLAFDLFKKTVKKLLITNYELKTEKQNEKEVVYTKKLTKELGFIKFEQLKFLISNQQSVIKNQVIDLFNLFRGLYPWPGIWTFLPNGKRLKIIDVELINGKLVIKKVQIEGKKEVDLSSFNKAYKVF